MSDEDMFPSNLSATLFDDPSCSDRSNFDNSEFYAPENFWAPCPRTQTAFGSEELISELPAMWNLSENIVKFLESSSSNGDGNSNLGGHVDASTIWRWSYPYNISQRTQMTSTKNWNPQESSGGNWRSTTSTQHVVLGEVVWVCH